MARKKPVNEGQSREVFRKPFRLEFKNSTQKLAQMAFDKHDVLFMLGAAGTGKAQPLDSILYNKNGSFQMKDVKIGDEIANPDGNFSKVTGIFPQGLKQICRIWFSDGDFVDCCEDHLWSISILPHKNDKVVDTKFIEKNCEESFLSITATAPVKFTKKTQDVDAYQFGLMIAESNKVIEKNGVLLGKSDFNNTAFGEDFCFNGYIPEEYLYGDIEQRISLFKGLIHGSGSFDFGVRFVTGNKELIKDVCELVFSLGGLTKISEIEDGYRVLIDLPWNIANLIDEDIDVCYGYRPKRLIDRVERLEFVEMQCISVDNKDQLYLTDNFTVTHNTFLACAFAIKEIQAKRKHRIIISRPIVESGESLGYLPGSFEEKTAPYMMPIVDSLSIILGTNNPERDRINQVLEVAPLAYLRGRNFSDSICLLDEAQNATFAQLKLFLTRFAGNSKVIITGDPRQSDIGSDSGLMKVVNRLKGLPGVGIVEFGNDCIVRHPLVGKIVDRLERETGNKRRPLIHNCDYEDFDDFEED
jgi:phosphate starvation-inducible protein PhoH